jgi:SAM-dependent methyltransferase
VQKKNKSNSLHKQIEKHAFPQMPPVGGGGGLPYGSLDYWNARYAAATPAEFDADEWYGPPGVAAVTAAVTALGLPPGAPALEVGCGGGRLSDTLAARMGLAVTATDASAVAVDRRRERAAAEGSSSDGKNPAWAVADATALPFPDAAFALVIDKGVCDALDCGDGGQPARAALAEAARVLRPGGALVLASCRDPAARAPLTAGLFETERVSEVWAEEDGDGARRRRGPCPEAYVYTLRCKKSGGGEGGGE